MLLLLCTCLQEKCPVKINTGDLIKQLRSEEMAQAPKASKVAMVSQQPAWQSVASGRSVRKWLGSAFM